MTACEPGARVLITFNAHEPSAQGILGTVVVFRPGEGFGGCDLVEVRYHSVREDREVVMPFGDHNLAVPDREALLNAAERLERQACEMRDLAAQLE